MRTRVQICLLLIWATCSTLEAQSPSSNDRVESIVSKMSIEEKIDYIGGPGSQFALCPVCGYSRSK